MLSEACVDWPGERSTINEMQSRIDAKTQTISKVEEEMADLEQDFEVLSEDELRDLARLQQRLKTLE